MVVLEHQPFSNSVVLSSKKAVGEANKVHGRLTPLFYLIRVIAHGALG